MPEKINGLYLNGWPSFDFTPAQILVISFALVIFTGAVLLTMPFSARPGVTISFVDALFTSTSAVCVTGLTCIDTVTNYSVPGQVIIMLLIQFGGLGIMTLVTFGMASIGQHVSLKFSLFAREDRPSHTSIGLLELIKYVFWITMTIEFLGALCMFIVFRSLPNFSTAKALYYSVFHAVSAFCNAGFALFTDNLMGFDGSVMINLTVTTLIIIGGIGFNTIVDIIYYFRSPIRYQLSLNTKIVLYMTAILLIFGTLMIFLIEYNNEKTISNMSFPQKVMASYFQSVSTRTAGFNTIDNGKMMLPTVLLCIILMFVGASPGGTGGGIKTTTAALLYKLVQRVIYDDDQVVIYNKGVPKESVSKAMAVFTISSVLVIVGTFALLFTENGMFIEVLYEVVSAFATVGLSMGLTGKLTTFGKLTISAIMFLGRVGSLTVVMSLAQSKPKHKIRYPEETVLIG